MTYKTAVLVGAFATTFWCAISGAQGTSSHQRLSPSEIDALAQTGPGAGTSGVSGIQTRVLKGDPTRSGVYAIQLTVPANTRIEAQISGFGPTGTRTIEGQQTRSAKP